MTSKISVKIPQTQRYVISTLDVDKNKLNKVKISSVIFNYSKVENTVQNLIQEIKNLKIGKYDEGMLVLNECLKMVRGIRYYDGEEYTILNLPRSAIQRYISIKNSISLKELVQAASKISTPQLTQSTKIFMKLITKISKRKFSVKNGIEELITNILSFTQTYSEIEQLVSEVEQQLPLITIEDFETMKSVVDKRLTRVLIKDLFEIGQKVNITTTKNYYFIAHLSQADLSMLSDFDRINEDLSIVNGSFVTLRDPIKYYGKNIQIRDTMLLPPSGRKSLAQIGKLS